MKHSITKNIYHHDTDCGGVVYYANYLKFLEEARDEYLVDYGVELKALASQGVLFAVSKVDIKYHVPAKYGDTIKVDSIIEKIKHTSMSFYQEIKKADTLLSSAHVEVVCVTPSFKLQKLPPWMRERLLGKGKL